MRDAKWWGQVWGTANVSKKVLKPGDVITITGTVYNGGVGEPRWICAWCNWNATGTHSVSITGFNAYESGIFDIVDYSPKAVPGVMNVTVQGNYAQWSAVDPPSPPNWINEHLYCKCDGGGAQGSEGQPKPDPPLFKKGDKCWIKLKVRQNAEPASGWSTVTVGYGGNIGALGWSDSATDYYAVDGDIGLSIEEIIPESIPANGNAISKIKARCYLKDNGYALPRQEIWFKTSLGSFGGKNQISVLTDANGIVNVELQAAKKTGLADVRVWIESGPENHATVEFKKPKSELILESEHKKMPADGKSNNEITATLLSDKEPVEGAKIWFRTDKGLLFDPNKEMQTEGDYLTKDAYVFTKSDGKASIFLVADDEEGKATITADYIPESFFDSSLKETVSVDMVFWGVKLITTKMDYLTIPSRGDKNPKTRVYGENEIAEPTYFGLTKTTVKVKLSGPEDASGKNILIKSDTKDQIERYHHNQPPAIVKERNSYIEFPENLITDENGEAEFTLEVSNIFDSDAGAWDIYHESLINKIDLKAELEENSDIKGEIILPVLNNYQRIIQLYEGSVWKGVVWSIRDDIPWPLRGLVNLLHAGFVNNSLSGGISAYAWIVTKLSGLGWTKPDNGESPFDYFTCGNYQQQVLYFLDSLRLSENMCTLLNGFDFGPIAMLWGGHQASEMYPQGKDPMDPPYTMILDPWPSQMPVASDAYLNTWQHAIGLSLIVTEVLNLHVAPGSSNFFHNTHYPNTGHEYPPKPEWNLSLMNVPQFQMLLDCPVHIVFKDLQNNQTGYAAGLSPDVNPLVAEIPDIEFYQTRLEDGTMSYYCALPNQYLTAEITAYGNGNITIHRFSANGVWEDYTALAITNGHKATLVFDPASPSNAPLVFDDARSFPPDVVYPKPTWTPLPTSTPTPTPTATPIPTNTPAPVQKDVRIVLGYQTPASLKALIESIISPLGITYEFIQEKAPGEGFFVEYWQLAGSKLILYTNNGNSGRRIGTLQTLQTARDAGIPLFLFDNDLAWSQFNYDAAMRSALQNLTHLKWTGSSGARHGYLVKPIDAQHPLWNGLGDIRVGADLDRTRTNDGDTALALDHEGRTVVSLYQAGSAKVLISLLDFQYEPQPPARFMQNAILWLLGKTPLTAPHDLTISNPSQISELVCGDQLVLSYRVTNSSANTLNASWKDKVYLSKDNKAGFDYLIGSADETRSLASSAYYDGSTTITIPNVAVGNYYIIMTTDDENTIAESNESDNALIIGTLAVKQANLTISNLRTVPAEGWPGMALPLKWTVANTGNGVAKASWVDGIFLVDDAIATRIMTLDTVVRAQNLPAGSSYDGETNIIIPPVSEGNYRIAALSDVNDVVPESTNEDNYIRSDALRIRHANLQIHDPATSPTASAGQYLPLRWWVTNNGSVPAAGKSRDAIYLSDDNQIGDDRYLGSFVWDETIAAGASTKRHVSVAIPRDMSGKYWVVIHVNPDGTLPETNGNDNQVIFGPVEIKLPNLIVAAIYDIPATGFTGGPALIKWKVKNIGEGAAEIGWRDCIYISSDNQIGNDILADMVERLRPLAPGEEYDAATTITLPSLAEGSYWIVVKTDYDEHVFESSEDDNTRISSASIDVNGPDLAIASFNAPLQIRPGEDIIASWKETNDGNHIAQAVWNDYLYLSPTQSFIGAQFLGRVEHQEDLLCCDPRDGILQFSIPVVPDGDYWFILVLDAANEVIENNETNNIQVLGPVSIRRPNLVIESLSIPTVLDIRDTITVRWRIRNKGDRPAIGIWKDAFYSSADNIIGNDVSMLNRDRPKDLLPGEAYDEATSLTLPASLAEGTYWFIFKTDDKQILIENRTDDNITSVPVTVRSPNLITVGKILPSEIYTEQKVFVRWTDFNIGLGKVNVNWRDVLYLSSDPNPGSDRSVFTAFLNAPLASGASVDVGTTVTIPTDLPEGNWWWILRTDNNYHVSESNEDDNYFTSGPVTLRRPNLALQKMQIPPAGNLNQPLVISYTAANTGVVPVDHIGSWNDKFYLSKDQVLNTSNDILIGTSKTTLKQKLMPGKALDLVTTLTLPSVPADDYYVIGFVDADKYVSETVEEADNILTLGTISINGPDLYTSGTLTLPASVDITQKIPLAWKMFNLGARQARAPWMEIIYLSTDAVYDWRDKEVLRFIQDHNLEPGAMLEEATTITIPVIPANNYWLIIRGDALNSVVETNENNNNLALGPFAITGNGPDLLVDNLTADIGALTTGTLDVKWRVANIGKVAANGTWKDTVFLWSNNVYYLMGSSPSKKTLDPNDSYQVHHTIPIPVSFVAGDYFIVIEISLTNEQLDINTDNNWMYIGPYKVMPSPPPTLWIYY